MRPVNLVGIGPRGRFSSFLKVFLADFLPFGGAGGPKSRWRAAPGGIARAWRTEAAAGTGTAEAATARAAARTTTGAAVAARPWATKAATGTGTTVATTAGAGPRAAAAVTAARPRTTVATTAWPWAPVAAAWTARTARSPGLALAGFADGQRTAHEQLAVKALDRFLGRTALGVFNKGKAAGPTGFPVEGADNLGRLTDLREMRAQVVFGGLIGQVTDEQSY